MVRLVRANLPGLPALTLRTCKYASRFVCTICADLEKFIYQDFGHYMFFHRRGPIFRGFQPRLHVPASTPQGSEQLCITPKQAVLLQLPAVFNKCRGAYTKVSEQLCITPKQAVPPGLPALTSRTCKYTPRFVCTICADLEKFIYQDFGQ